MNDIVKKRFFFLPILGFLFLESTIIALLDFDGDLGQFPGDNTAIVHESEDGNDLSSFKGR